jgi:hypothetical protein
MINRDRMSEAEWMQRLTNLRARLERDSDNVYELSSMMETGSWSPLAGGDEQNQLVEIADLMFRAKNMLASVIENHHAEA